jgi:ABC-type Mn2+/Zn2+ transport system permease subunit
MCLTLVHAAISSVLGVHLAIWLNCSTAGAMVVVGVLLFNLAWIFSPSQGLLAKVLHRKTTETPPVPEPSSL